VEESPEFLFEQLRCEQTAVPPPGIANLVMALRFPMSIVRDVRGMPHCLILWVILNTRGPVPRGRALNSVSAGIDALQFIEKLLLVWHSF
jgi:hypothetical protein